MFGPLYHGSSTKFDLKNDFDFQKGVGVIYTFVGAGAKHAGTSYARYLGRDHYQYVKSETYLYEIWLKSSANIVDLTKWNSTTQKIAQVMDDSPGAIDEKTWMDFVTCSGNTECVFDILDYNEELVKILIDMGIDGLYFIDGLDEISNFILEPNVPAVALFDVTAIDKVIIHDVEVWQNEDENKDEGNVLEQTQKLKGLIMSEALAIIKDIK